MQGGQTEGGEVRMPEAFKASCPYCNEALSLEVTQVTATQNRTWADVDLRFDSKAARQHLAKHYETDGES